jgi:hypothetical protein
VTIQEVKAVVKWRIMKKDYTSFAIENKINDTKDLMKCNANETDKRVDK